MPKLPRNKDYTDKFLQNEKKQNYLIVKGNRIVQDSHFTMSLIDQKVLASLIRSIKPNQNTLTVKFSVRQFINILGLSRSGTSYLNIKAALWSILNDNFFIKMPNGKDVSWRWLDRVVGNPNTKNGGEFIVKFNPRLRSYLFNQSMKYRTIYRFSDIMLMRSRYSPRLFEIFRSNQSRQKIQKLGLDYSISELRYSLNLMKRKKGIIQHDIHGNIKYKYPQYGSFKSRILKPALKEINRFTEYNVKMTPIKQGRSVVAINVRMKKKNKRERQKRNDLIYCIVHNVSKKEWPYWRSDSIKGNYRLVEHDGKLVRRYPSHIKKQAHQPKQQSLIKGKMSDNERKRKEYLKILKRKKKLLKQIKQIEAKEKSKSKSN